MSVQRLDPPGGPDPRFTPAHADELLAVDRRLERRLPWKQLLALLVVVAVVVVRQLWLG